MKPKILTHVSPHSAIFGKDCLIWRAKTDSLILQSDTTPFDGQKMNTGTHDSTEFDVLIIKRDDFKKCPIFAF